MKTITLVEIYEICKSSATDLDEPLTRYILRPITTPIVYLSVRFKIHPHWITFMFIFWGLLAAIPLSTQTESGFCFSGMLLIIHYIFDLADGLVARVRSLTSPLGALLDAVGHAVVNTSLSIVVAQSWGEAAALSFCLSITPGAYAFFLTRKNYASRLGFVNYSTFKVPSTEFKLGKAAVFFVGYPGLAYLLIILGLTKQISLLLCVSMLSSALMAVLIISVVLRNRIENRENQKEVS